MTSFPRFVRDPFALRTYINGEYRHEVPEGEELSVVLDANFARPWLRGIVRRSRASCPDTRHPGDYVGFIPVDEGSLFDLFNNRLAGEILVHPRSVVEAQPVKFCKFAGVVFVSCGNNVLLVPRGKKTILPDVWTLAVMEGLEPKDFCDGRKPTTVEAVIRRGMMEELHGILPGEVRFSGLVSGVKGDLGIVCGLECVDMTQLREVARTVGGEVFDCHKLLYSDLVNDRGGRTDGWSFSILHHIRCWNI